SILLINCLLTLFAAPLRAQVPDSLIIPTLVQEQADSSRPKLNFRPKNLRLGMDIVPPLVFAFDQDAWEISVYGELEFNPVFQMSFDIGQARRIRSGDGHRYESQGFYVRLGFDYNIWHKNTSGAGALFNIGLYYGIARFQHELSFQRAGSYWEGIDENLEANGLQRGWLEIRSSLKAKIGKNFFFGPVARLMLGLGSDDDAPLAVNDVPGYGLNNRVKLRAGYLLLYQIPLTKN
ncbi:MAG: DUF6048 family protein, partial [Bacteroidota bacterium]